MRAGRFCVCICRVLRTILIAKFQHMEQLLRSGGLMERQAAYNDALLRILSYGQKLTRHQEVTDLLIIHLQKEEQRLYKYVFFLL